MANSINYIPQKEPDFTGPAWNNSNEYPSLVSNEFTYDQHQLESLITRLDEALVSASFDSITADSAVKIAHLQSVTELEEQAWILLGNMRTYAHCLSVVDGTNTDARAALSQLTATSGRLEALMKPVHVYLMTAPEDVLEKYFNHAHVRPHEFKVRYARQICDTLLTEAEESLIARLKANGPLAFGSQYDQLSSNIRCEYEEPYEKAGSSAQFRQIGLAEAAGLLRNADAAKRKNAWHAIQAGWRTQETAAASGLNAIAGWRLEIDAQRSRRRALAQPGAKPVHFLDLPLHESRIKRETLDAMMSAVSSKREIGRRAVRAMAKAHGKSKLDPWDLLAPAPNKSVGETRLTFEKGIGLIREAFDAVDPSLSDFVDTMKKNRWIEGRQLPTKRPGAFCTKYPKSSSPRVFQTYMGSLEDVRTLAHELGHAYHSWVMRDLPRPLLAYPMTIAETASIFAETAFSDSLLTKARAAGDTHSAFEIAWQNAESAASHILNIPARFDFEVSFYQRRKQGYVGPEDLGTLMNDAWKNWYGDTLTENETQYWMTKLHFSIPTTSFYNYPYTFGALFSLGIYALRKERGAAFWPSYNALLRDTGRMTAEDLAKKHLGVDLTNETFWLNSLAIIDAQVAELEILV